MKIDNIRKYIDLKTSLVREKAQLEEQLRQINEALGDAEEAAPASAPAPSAPRAPAPSRAKRGGRRGRPTAGGLSLREAVLQVTASGPKTKQEILDGVDALGYKFTTNNPLNSLGVILYGKNPKFRNENGRFSPAGGAAAKKGGGGGKQTGGEGSGSAFSRKKRQLSPEARERIAAAQRARWAKTRGGR